MGLFFDFERNKDSFLLMGDNTKVWKVEITKPSIRVRKCSIHEKVKIQRIAHTHFEMFLMLYIFKLVNLMIREPRIKN